MNEFTWQQFGQEFCVSVFVHTISIFASNLFVFRTQSILSLTLQKNALSHLSLAYFEHNLYANEED